MDAAIARQLSLLGAQLTGHDDDGTALSVDGMKVGGSVLLGDEFTAAGTLRLLAVEITASPTAAARS